MKKIIWVLIVLLVAVSISAPAIAVGNFSAGEYEGKTVVLHTNDSHSRVTDYMGFTAVAALKDAYEAAGATVLTFDAGDTLHGLPIATMYEGASIIDIMNMVGYDAMTTGNHDYNYGYDRLYELASKADFPVLAANVVEAETGNTLFESNTIIERDGKTYGVFGLATPETAYKTHPDNVAGLSFENPITAAEQQVEQLQAEGVDYIIAIGHIGLIPSSEFTSEMICEQVDGIDLFIDGHSHTVLENGHEVNDTLIVSTGEYIQNIGVVIMDENGSEAMLVNEEQFSGTNESVDALVSDIEADLDVLLSEVIGYTNVYLNGEREFVRTQETNLGNLSADSILYETGADVSMVNGGGIRASIEVGNITKGDLITVFPFGGYIVTKNMTGQAIHDALEHGMRSYPDAAGGFPQVGGVSFSFDASKEPYDRIEPSDIYIAGEPLELDREYLFATNDYLSAGGDGYSMIGDLPIVNEYPCIDEIMIKYIASLDDLSMYAGTEGRIRPLGLFTVTFIDSLTGDIIDTQSVGLGEDATAPEAPVHEYHDFWGWSCEFTNVTSDLDVIALYSIHSYNIEINSTGGGSVTPSGIVTVDHGDDITINIVPDDGHHVASISINGAVVAENLSESSYTVKNVTRDSKIEIKFEKDASSPSDPPKAGAASAAVLGGIMIIAGICPLLVKKRV